MLKITGLEKTFEAGTINEKKALCGIDLTLSEGDFVTVIGGNGAGKSTLLNAIAGVFPIDKGHIFRGDQEITRLPEHKRARLLGRVFQDPMMGTAADMGLQENLALAYRRGQHRTLKWGITKMERAFFREQLLQLELGLEQSQDYQMVYGFDFENAYGVRQELEEYFSSVLAEGRSEFLRCLNSGMSIEEAAETMNYGQKADKFYRRVEEMFDKQ